MAAWEICPTCGVVVADPSVHAAFHARVDTDPAPAPDAQEAPDVS